MGRKNHGKPKYGPAFEKEVVEPPYRLSRRVRASAAALAGIESSFSGTRAQVAYVQRIRASRCCEPFPYATFRHESLQSIAYVHRGFECFGIREEVHLGAWRRA